MKYKLLLITVIVYFSCNQKIETETFNPTFSEEKKLKYRNLLDTLQTRVDFLVYNDTIEVESFESMADKIKLDSITKERLFSNILDTSIIQIDIFIRSGNARTLVLNDLDFYYNVGDVITDTISNNIQGALMEIYFICKTGSYRVYKEDGTVINYEKIIKTQKEYFDRNNKLIDISIFHKNN